MTSSAVNYQFTPLIWYGVRGIITVPDSSGVVWFHLYCTAEEVTRSAATRRARLVRGNDRTYSGARSRRTTRSTWKLAHEILRCEPIAPYFGNDVLQIAKIRPKAGSSSVLLNTGLNV